MRPRMGRRRQVVVSTRDPQTNAPAPGEAGTSTYLDLLDHPGQTDPVRDEISLEHSKLRADVEVVRKYGDAHPEAWVELRFENEPTVRIVALFAGDALEIHEGALRRLVSHPNQLEVQPSPWPRVRLDEIQAEVHEMATSSEPGLFSGWGTGRQGQRQAPC